MNRPVKTWDILVSENAGHHRTHIDLQEWSIRSKIITLYNSSYLLVNLYDMVVGCNVIGELKKPVLTHWHIDEWQRQKLTWFKDKLKYKDVQVLSVCIWSLTGYFFYLFIN